MTPIDTQIESRLIDPSQGFDQLYTQVKSLYSRIKKSPDTITHQTVDALIFVVQSNQHLSQRQHYFLYKEAADILVFIVVHSKKKWTEPIIHSLEKLVASTKGRRQRAVSESLGSLPLSISGPDICLKEQVAVMELSFKDLLHHLGNPDPGLMTWHGRTLRFQMADNTIGCIKFASSADNIKLLDLEVQWLLYLNESVDFKKESFHIPSPFFMADHCLFKLNDLPGSLEQGNDLCKVYPAIIFITVQEYYRYPNEGFKGELTLESVSEIYTRNARLMGLFISKGIIHTAIIPLFHNRAQQRRREDHGVYLWEHGGRLDQWLKSCQYPNFAASGLRDFEHLISIKNSRGLRHYLGEHVLGFFLLLGSTFRNLEPHCGGWDESGDPYDLTHLFDADYFYQTIQQILMNYFNAITDKSFECHKKMLKMDLISKLIMAMGKDTHMEETLRVEDQKNMNHELFYEFLLTRGYDKTKLKSLIKDKTDIILKSGPHLGGFNQVISVPEIIELLFTFSSICVAERYLSENGLKGQAN